MAINTKEQALNELLFDKVAKRISETLVRRTVKCMMILGISESEIPNFMQHFEIYVQANSAWLPVIQDEIDKYNKQAKRKSN